jgi:hypothetical protein
MTKRKIIDSLHHLPSLRETVERMYSDGKLNKDRQEYVNMYLEEWMADSKYILFNLGVHIGIGFIRFTALPFPVPIGTVLRPIWVAGNRIHCDLRWDMQRKKIHSLTVFFFSMIPFLGYFAYTIPLKKKSEYLAYLYAQHITYGLYNKTLEEKLEKAPPMLRKLAYTILVPAEIRPRT